MSSELAVVYASLILHDADVPITSDNLTTLIRAANVTIEPIWCKLFAKALETTDLRSLLSNVGSAPAAAPMASSVAATSASAGAGAAVEKKEEVQEKEESDEDLGFGLFD
ncbi:60S acidic ribosomal protein P1 [Coelomomyces lativittatus]|nr:60S acidic ribosomal protein P1 [Coelomomyces lativittatus]KAJ1504295.1 60S acidic ribosomal protein P1 [Coelomomyces lativittatus]KAJ1509003.1 60S acidic ribosomal protein P1 [Coelomomyces lativittatus]